MEFVSYKKPKIQKSFLEKKETAKRKWYVIDASGQILGRLATRVATILMGKHKPTYTPHVDTGDHVIIINADKICLTGKKAEKKVYQYYSGYHSGRKVVPFKKIFTKNPAKIVYLAVKRMLPKTNLGEKMLKKLRIYAGHEHPHQAQSPVVLDISHK